MMVVVLNEKDLAKRLSISVAKLRKDRIQKRGIPYIKIGGSVRYAMKDIEAYLNENLIMPKEKTWIKT